MKTNNDKRYAIALIVLVAMVGIGSLWVKNMLTFAIVIVIIALAIYIIYKLLFWLLKTL